MKSDSTDKVFSSLSGLIGRHIEYEGIRYQVIDVLLDGPALALHQYDDSEIQSDQFGEAQRRAPKTHTLPVLNPADDDLHPVIIELLDPKELISVRSLLGI